MEWSKDKIIKVIKLYEERPCLWNVMVDDHKDTVKKREAWQEIGAEMDLHFLDVEKKMKSILAQYRRERRKSPGLYEGRPRWFAYQYLTFLNSVNKSRRSVESMLFKELRAQGYKVEYPDEDEDDIKVPFMIVNNDKVAKNEPLSESYKFEVHSEDDEDGEKSFVIVNSEKRKRKRLKHDETQSSCVDEVEVETKEDTFDHYGKYIASVLRSLPMQNAFKLQQQFSELLLKEQLETCEATKE